VLSPWMLQPMQWCFYHTTHAQERHPPIICNSVLVGGIEGLAT
jgi:hypothetical protein